MNQLMQITALVEMSITCAAIIILLLQKTASSELPGITKVLSLIHI